MRRFFPTVLIKEQTAWFLSQAFIHEKLLLVVLLRKEHFELSN